MKRALLASAAVAFCSCPHRVTPPTSPVPDAGTAGPAVPLVGFVDLHTHPMASLGFAGKLVYGGPDWSPSGGALLPSDPDCNRDVRATSLDQALGHDRSTHGGWDLSNTCGDTIRSLVISAVQDMNQANNPPSDAVGAPAFLEWPMSNDVTHQVMWVEAVKRAHDAGLRVMVALAVNNQTLADTVAGHSDGPDDDQSSADLQIEELKQMVGRNASFMEVAYSSADVRRIVAAGRLAVVLGLEVDNIGNFNTVPNLTAADIAAELQRLRSLGVRYLFPVHVIDNPFGTTAANQDIFNLSNLREAGHFWNLLCAAPTDGVSYRPSMKNPLRDPFSDPQTAQMAFLMVFKLHLFSLDDPSPPACPLDGGVVNVGSAHPGLTPNGEVALREAMRQCMLLDVDHMSQAAANDALRLMIDAGYPINSGHNNVRGPLGGQTERQLTAAQYAQVASVGGLAGVGSARADPAKWVALSEEVLHALGDGGHLAFGTDSNGVSPLMSAPSGGTPVTYSGAYPRSTLGAKTWDFNDAGVAHYGMLSDFLEGVKLVDGGAAVLGNLMQGAQAFHDTWARAEAACALLGAFDAGSPAPPAPTHRHFLMSAPPPCPDGQRFRAACNRCLPLRARCPPCDETDAGTDCVRAPQCPAGRSRNAWGVCSPSAALEDRKHLELPMAAQLQRAPATGPKVPPGKYLLTLTPEGGKPMAFVAELGESGAGWTVKGKQARLPATGGYFNGTWALEWKAGKSVVMLLVKPSAAAQAGAQQSAPAPGVLRGGFAVHRPKSRTVTGELMLEPLGKKTPTGALPLEQLAPQLEPLLQPR